MQSVFFSRFIFLSHVGIKVTYDLCKPSGSRVVSLYTRCGNCWIPTYKPLNDNKVYTVIALNFLINGGDGYSVVTDNLIKHIEYSKFIYLLDCGYILILVM